MPVIICWLLFGDSMDIIDVPTRVPSQDLFTIIVIIVPQFAQPVKRLMVEDLLQKHPEILERRLAPPVVIVGLARSGTTRLHRLLAQDAQFLHLVMNTFI